MANSKYSVRLNSVVQLFSDFCVILHSSEPGDEETRCVERNGAPSYPDTERNLMDSCNYEDLVPGNGTGSIIATAVWNDYSFDGNDADDFVAPTYVSFLNLLSWLMFMSNLHTVAAIS